MPHRLTLLIVLLLFSGLLLTAGAAHGAPAEAEPAPLALEEPLEDEAEEEGGVEEESECEATEEEDEELCDEEAADSRPTAHHSHRGRHRVHQHRHKKACGHKRHCSHRR